MDSKVHRRESSVAAYSRQWPAEFVRARGSWLTDADGRRYLDFFSAAGALNLGHNEPLLVEAMVRYLRADGPLCTLDMATRARTELIDELRRLLDERELPHRVQFTSPSGTASVEAALRLARKVTGRTRVAALDGSFHGMSLDASLLSGLGPRSGQPTIVGGEYVLLPHPEAGGEEGMVAMAAAALQDGSVAALVIEVVQGEGGARTMSTPVLLAIEGICKETGTVLVVDDIQAGCGRTGPFFSFERSGIQPGMVCLSKSLSGIGLPLSVLLVHPTLDDWSPGEHSGTFRGNDLAMVTATLALRHWWADDVLAREVGRKSAVVLSHLGTSAEMLGSGRPRGSGLLVGLPCRDAETAQAIASNAFSRGLLVETCGEQGQILKLLPPLTVTDAELAEGTSVLEAAVRSVIGGAERHG